MDDAQASFQIQDRVDSANRKRKRTIMTTSPQIIRRFLGCYRQSLIVKIHVCSVE